MSLQTAHASIDTATVGKSAEIDPHTFPVSRCPHSHSSLTLYNVYGSYPWSVRKLHEHVPFDPRQTGARRIGKTLMQGAWRRYSMGFYHTVECSRRCKQRQPFQSESWTLESRGMQRRYCRECWEGSRNDKFPSYPPDAYGILSRTTIRR